MTLIAARTTATCCGFTFTVPLARTLIADWQMRARRLCAEFRTDSIRHLNEAPTRMLTAYGFVDADQRNAFVQRGLDDRGFASIKCVGQPGIDSYRLRPAFQPVRLLEASSGVVLVTMAG
jgi:hypothetical protein